MFELNLIKDAVQRVEKRKKYVAYFKISYAVCFFVFLLVAGYSVYLSSEVSRFSNDLSTLKEKMKQRKKMYQIDHLEQEGNEYFAKLLRLEGFLDRRTAWALRLSELSRVLPKDMCISKVSVSGQGGSLAIEAIVIPKEKQGFEIMDDFIGVLEKNQMFGKGVKLESQSKKDISGRKAELFRISIPYPGENEPR